MKRDLNKLSQEEFDLVIVGGGVSGASIAWDAALRGLRVALIEKKDFGSGTSTATSKLIHGGLRYLKNLELGLVRESLRERRTLEELAPHLVYPLPFVIPVYGWVMFLMMFIGMILYELLSFDKARLNDPSKRLPHFSMFSKQTLLARDANLLPTLQNKPLIAGFQYYDCQSLNPDRLTLAFVKSAVEAGATVANYVRAEGVLKEGDTVKGVVARDMLDEREITIRGKLVVVAAGPWADIVLAKAMGHPPQTRIRRSKGIHVITDEFRTDFALTLPSKTGGHFFIIPWRNHTLIGTTDTEFVGKPDECDVNAEDIHNFLAGVNEAYGSKKKYAPEDVSFGYAGLRPLVDKQTKSVYNVSRKHEVVDHAEEGFKNMLSVLGGKYTTSRELAEGLVDTVMQRLGKQSQCKTQNQRLFGGDIDDMERFVGTAKTELSFLNEKAADLLPRQFGTEYRAVAQIAKENPQWAKPVGYGDSILAEAVYAIRHEMALTLEDILFRRTGIATLGNPGAEVLREVADIAQRELGWTAERTARELAAVSAQLDYPRLAGVAQA
jgi:glycerol-3-phosphate dehydrogenase